MAGGGGGGGMNWEIGTDMYTLMCIKWITKKKKRNKKETMTHSAVLLLLSHKEMPLSGRGSEGFS